jgi:UDP-N-acetylmuramoyl-L-alanyl-D-glutamate--2,6-diaminopimelate ligase
MKPLQQFLPEAGSADVPIHGIAMDSRKVEPGDLFIAVAGTVRDGQCFIGDAIERGAAAVVRPPVGGEPVLNGIPVFEIEDLSVKVGEIASRFYDEPSQDLTVIAVTGTNGKTTVTSLIAEAMSSLGRSCGVIGTLGFGRSTGHLTETGLTTPDPVSLQRQLAHLYQQQCQFVALEASSHGLIQGRLNGTRVSASILTNLTQDHLDYHGDMESYQRAKELLFELPGLQLRVVNLDDDLGKDLDRRYQGDGMLSFSLDESAGASIYSRRSSFSTTGLSAELVTPRGCTDLTSVLLGPHNLSNLLAAAAVLHWQGYAAEAIGEALSAIKAVPGRMEVIEIDDHASAVIDFAHSADALLNVLATLRQRKPKKLICVFGCGGDRDRGKRQQMGAVAASLADVIVLTNDNPRSESPQLIVEEILMGIPGDTLVEIELDRGKAIGRAMEMLSGRDGDGGVVLIAGKGHENYQEVNSERIHFNDRETVLNFISSN